MKVGTIAREKTEDEEEEGQFNHIKTVTCKIICSVPGNR